ncbi:unnamed protein product [Lota lota]
MRGIDVRMSQELCDRLLPKRAHGRVPDCDVALHTQRLDDERGGKHTVANRKVFKQQQPPPWPSLEGDSATPRTAPVACPAAAPAAHDDGADQRTAHFAHRE